jgi:hypothetical protein
MFTFMECKGKNKALYRDRDFQKVILARQEAGVLINSIFVFTLRMLRRFENNCVMPRIFTIVLFTILFCISDRIPI